jgi:hypothetical protein
VADIYRIEQYDSQIAQASAANPTRVVADGKLHIAPVANGLVDPAEGLALAEQAEDPSNTVIEENSYLIAGREGARVTVVRLGEEARLA